MTKYLRNKYFTDLLHKYSSGKYYSWYTMRTSNTVFNYIVHDDDILTKYVAVGTAICSAFVNSGRITEDTEDYMCIYAECEYKKFCMKGGHTYNHVQNVRIRKSTRHKTLRKSLKQARNNFTHDNASNLMLSMCNTRS